MAYWRARCAPGHNGLARPAGGTGRVAPPQWLVALAQRNGLDVAQALAEERGADPLELLRRIADHERHAAVGRGRRVQRRVPELAGHHGGPLRGAVYEPDTPP